MHDDEIARFRAGMRLLRRRLHRESLPVVGLSRTAVGVLSAASRLPGVPQPRQIAEELDMTSSNVAAALRELETAGCVVRRRDEVDARCVLVEVTPHGQELLATNRRERDSWLGQAIEALLDRDEQRTLAQAGRLMERLAAFEPESEPEPNSQPGQQRGRAASAAPKEAQ